MTVQKKADPSPLNHLTCLTAREIFIALRRLEIFRSDRCCQYDAWRYGDPDGGE